MRIVTYVEEELAVDHLSSGGLREVLAKEVVVEGHLLELLRVELFVPRNRHWAKFSVRDQLFLATQSVAHELHCAVVERRQMELTFNREYDVEVLLRLDEVSEIRRNHLCSVGIRVGGHTQCGFLQLGLRKPLLLLLIKHKLLSCLVKGLVLVLLVSDEVRHETRAHQIELLLHLDGRF